ncbi:hypothetical protein M3A49_26800 [Paraburkholderia sp. CNPSo 3076]|uniref:hypothetical protein n=1 Tax=Paraburkholderia sp. CNPSo 3076 TaxID=2940936 RepID=UPI00224F7866|nr:hypothetical protein [Paraburkholderia sp. CNPSo 3076]MCX5543055.1 hypothetical protein [Paraburkholderia sp. CNPSo 3076]
MGGLLMDAASPRATRVARQPITDIKGRLAGYELLHIVKLETPPPSTRCWR